MSAPSEQFKEAHERIKSLIRAARMKALAAETQAKQHYAEASALDEALSVIEECAKGPAKDRPIPGANL